MGTAMSSPVSDSLPETAISKDGFEFNPRATKWKLSPDNSVDFKRILKLAGPTLYFGLNKVLLYYAQNYAAATANINATYFESFLRFVSATHGIVDRIEPEHLLDYRASLTSKRESYIGHIRPMIRQWVEFGYEGIDPSCRELLYS
jgi:hypothetical protein